MHHIRLLVRSDGVMPMPATPAALQGLAEVLAVMGDSHLNELLPELLASATSKNPFVREGHLTLFR